jgi:hypothetical protein
MFSFTHDLVQHSPAPARVGGVRRRPAMARRQRERYFRSVVSLAAALAALLLFATATKSQVMPPVGAMPVGWYALGDRTGDYVVGTDPAAATADRARVVGLFAH